MFLTFLGKKDSDKQDFIQRLSKEWLKIARKPNTYMITGKSIDSVSKIRDSLQPFELQMAIESHVAELERHRRGRITLTTTSIISRCAYARVNKLGLDALYGLLLAKSIPTYDLIFYRPLMTFLKYSEYDAAVDLEIRNILKTFKVTPHILLGYDDFSLTQVMETLKVRRGLC